MRYARLPHQPVEARPRTGESFKVAERLAPLMVRGGRSLAQQGLGEERGKLHAELIVDVGLSVFQHLWVTMDPDKDRK